MIVVHVRNVVSMDIPFIVLYSLFHLLSVCFGYLPCLNNYAGLFYSKCSYVNGITWISVCIAPAYDR